MFMYQIRTVVKKDKFDEYVQSLCLLSDGFRKEKGCLDFSLYRNIEKENSYSLVGEWRTRQAMEKHFKNENFSVMIGAARVLCEAFEMNIGENSETGGFTLAREKINLQKKESTAIELRSDEGSSGKENGNGYTRDQESAPHS